MKSPDELFHFAIQVVCRTFLLDSPSVLKQDRHWEIALARHFLVLSLRRIGMPAYEIERRLGKSRGCANNSILRAEAAIATNQYHRSIFETIFSQITNHIPSCKDTSLEK